MSKITTAPSATTLAVFRLAALFSFLAVAMGTVVCATNAGAACPTWPGCHHDQLAPGWQLSPIIEFTHRVVAIGAGPLLLAAAVAGTRFRSLDRWVLALPWCAVVAAVLAGVFGRAVVLGKLPAWLVAIDLLCALLAMILMTLAAVWADRPAAAVTASRAEGAFPQADQRERLVNRLAALSLALLVVMHVTGIFTAGKGSYTRCVGWPLWQRVANDLHPWLQNLRFGLAVLGAAFVISTAVIAAGGQRLRPWGVLLAALLAAEVVVGMLISAWGLGSGVAVVYSVIAVALLWCLSLLTGLTRATRSMNETGSPDRLPATTLR